MLFSLGLCAEDALASCTACTSGCSKFLSLGCSLATVCHHVDMSSPCDMGVVSGADERFVIVWAIRSFVCCFN